MDHELREIRLHRRRMLIELSLLLAASVSLGFLETPLASDSLLSVAAFATVLLLYLAASGRFCLHLIATLKAPCPRCSGLFFVSWNRMLFTLPYLADSCAHCGASFRRRKPSA